MKILRRIGGALLLLILALAALLWLKPPALLRVGANYSAKIVCSNVFLGGRDPDEVLRVDVQAPGIALLKAMHVSVDRERGVVRAGFLGFIGGGVAVARPGRGCTVVPDGNFESVAGAPAPMAYVGPPHITPVVSPPWPEGRSVETQPTVDQVLNDAALAGPGARAIVVVDHGRIVGEHYAGGFNPDTPLLGWSMTKTVMAGVIGMLIKDGKLSLDQAGFWTGKDGREKIRLKDLLAMSSGLQWNEAYGAVSDVTSMLYLQPDMAAFARSPPLAHPPGEVWLYSSGTAVILSRIAEDAQAQSAGKPKDFATSIHAPDEPHDLASFINVRLFGPLGITTATIEPDEHGSLVGSSYMYATARDWARYGLFLLQDGIWQGKELLPPGYVAMMTTPVEASHGQYGMGQTWLWGSDAVTPGVNPDAAFDIPSDAFWMSGHDGQSVCIIKSRQMVIVRLGLTPYAAGYTSQRLVQAVLKATH
ncbi:MAG TPA: serine hydrolase [Steroidobacteraceae bacterium]|nr:serine hydrolase [Steroidobacteraceae bacterium]